MRSKLKQLLLLATFVLNPSFAVCQQSSITVKTRDIAKQMYPGWNLGNKLYCRISEYDNFQSRDIESE